mmetsp:Transcript_6058/g.9211  ORF Transcript_6058/g.9211 Transcript_6058/m.9211 type:complete len:757 (-) Transcript_6058:231-2501(-)
MNEKRKKDDESSSATELSSSMAAPSNHKTTDAAATSTSEYDRINSLFLSVEGNKDEEEEKKATPEKSKNSKKKRGKVEEDYCLPPSSHSSSSKEEEGVTNRSSSSEEFYESFPRAPRTSIPEPERSCCSHGMTFAIGLFILLHFACCLVSWFVPWWDGDLHVTLSKEDTNTRDWEFWKDAHVPALENQSFGSILSDLTSSGAIVVLILVILSAVVLPSIHIIAQTILVFIVHERTAYNRSVDKDDTPTSTTLEKEEETEKEEEVKRNALLLEEELLEAPFANAPTTENDLTEPLLSPLCSKPTTERSIEIEELPPTTNNDTTDNKRLSFLRKCLPKCKCLTKFITVELTLLFFEFLYKYASCLIYFFTLVFIALSGIVLDFNDTNINNDTAEQAHPNHQVLSIKACVINETKGGYVGYFLGINFGIIATILLRAHLNHERRKDGEEDVKVGNERVATRGWSSFGMEEQDSGVRTPPLSAFRSHQLSRSSSFGLSSTIEAAGVMSRSAIVEEDVAFLHPDGSDFTTTTTTNNNGAKYNIRTWKFWKNLLIFETGLFSILLLVPTYAMPILRLDYDGLASPLLEHSRRDLTIWNILCLAWLNPTGKNYLARVLTTGFIWTNVIFCPLIALICAMVVRLDLAGILAKCRMSCLLRKRMDLRTITNTTSSHSHKVPWIRALQYVYPLASASPFALCILLGALAIKDLSHDKLNGVCDAVKLDRACLEIEGGLLAGSWFCFAQALVFDIFVCLTLIDFQEE